MTGEGPTDVLLCDVGLPDGDGYGLLRVPVEALRSGTVASRDCVGGQAPGASLIPHSFILFSKVL